MSIINSDGALRPISTTLSCNIRANPGVCPRMFSVFALPFGTLLQTSTKNQYSSQVTHLLTPKGNSRDGAES